MKGGKRFRYEPGDVVPGANVRVLRPLGRGGHGTVYEVEHVLLDGERYVLKVIRAELTKRGRKQVEREAKLLSKLRRHPNIVQVVWAGWTADEPSLFYLALESLPGVTLGQLLRSLSRSSTGVPLELVFYIANGVLSALRHAHESLIVHRDVKPENIFLHTGEDPSKPWTPKLLDFGIGIILSEGRRTTTNTGFTGTYAYAAPEQFLGERVTPACDIYSLGLVLYEMLAGRAPFAEQTNDAALADAHIHQPPPPLSQWRKVSPKFEDLVHRMLDKDPVRRPRDEAIENSLESLRVEARAEAPLEFSTPERPLWKTILPDEGPLDAETVVDRFVPVFAPRVASERAGPARETSKQVDATVPSTDAISLSAVDSFEIPLGGNAGRPSPRPHAGAGERVATSHRAKRLPGDATAPLTMPSEVPASSSGRRRFVLQLAVGTLAALACLLVGLLAWQNGSAARTGSP